MSRGPQRLPDWENLGRTGTGHSPVRYPAGSPLECLATLPAPESADYHRCRKISGHKGPHACLICPQVKWEFGRFKT